MGVFCLTLLRISNLYSGDMLWPGDIIFTNLQFLVDVDFLYRHWFIYWCMIDMQQLFLDVLGPWIKNKKEKHLVASILTSIIVAWELMSMRSLLRRADCGLSFRTLALCSFL